MNRKRGLGRGLDALLGTGTGPSGSSPSADATGDTLKTLPVELIRRGRFQPRLSLRPEALEELAASIRAQGIVQPVVVRSLGDGGPYELIAGERRWRAAQLAGLSEIPAIVRVLPDRTVMSIALIENIQREQLHPLEEAQALQRLLTEFGLTHQEAAEAIGRSRAAVSNLLRLLELGPEARKLLEEGALEMGHARALLALRGPEQGRLATLVAERGLSVRAAEEMVRRALEARPAAPPRPQDPNTRKLEAELGEKLGARVAIKHGAKGRGQLVISYNSLDELDGILGHIR